MRMHLFASIIVFAVAVAALLGGLISVLNDLVLRGPHASPDLSHRDADWRPSFEAIPPDEKARPAAGAAEQEAEPLDLDLARDFHHAFRSQIEPVDHLD